MVRKSSLNGADKDDFEFAEHQLGVVDIKANNVLMVDSVLIVISSIGIIFHKDASFLLKSIMTAATISILISVGLCLWTIKTKWANELSVKLGSNLIDSVNELRNSKTRFLHGALIALGISLGLFVSSFLIDLLS